MDYGTARGLEFARRDYQRALRLDPLCLPARINLAYTAQVAGKLMQAWRHFTMVIQVRPSEGNYFCFCLINGTDGRFGARLTSNQTNLGL